MLARAKSFQVGSSSCSNSKGGNNWRSEKSGSPPSTNKTNTWRRESSSSPNNNNNNTNNNKIEERRREADLARMKEEIVREVREEVIFTFIFSFSKVLFTFSWQSIFCFCKRIIFMTSWES